MTHTAIPMRALVLDNDEAVHDKARHELHSFSGIQLLHAKTLKDVEECIRENYIDLAFIDLNLRSESGVDAINMIADIAPSCRIFVLTRYHEQLGGDSAADLIAPGSPVRGVINKSQDAVRWFGPVVQAAIDATARALVRRVHLDALVDAVTRKRHEIDLDLKVPGVPRNPCLRASPDEVRVELTRLLDQIYGPTRLEGVDRPRPVLSLSVIRSGYSSSVVSQVIPLYEGEHGSSVGTGLPTILKVGPMSQIKVEHERYRGTVRFGLRGSARVELLGYATGDALAAICYSFASEESGDVVTLETWLEQRQSPKNIATMTSRILSYEFAGMTPYVGGDGLLAYFKDERGAAPAGSLALVDKWLSDLVERGLGTIDDASRQGQERHKAYYRSVNLGSRCLWVPHRTLLGTALIRRPVLMKVLHGDLHAGNVILDGDGRRVRLIDYRNTGVGPAFVDAVALASSLRLIEVRTTWGAERTPIASDVLLRMAEMYEAEVAFAQASRFVIRNKTPAEAWISGANSVGRHVARTQPPRGRAEFLWTSLLHCLFMFTIDSLTETEKVRLLFWLDGLTRACVEIERERIRSSESGDSTE